MICEVRGVFPTVPNNALSVRGRQRAAAGGTSGRAHSHTLAHSHALPGAHTRSLLFGRQAGTLAPTHSRLPSPTPTCMYFCSEKSVNKASLAPNEAFLPDFFGSIKQTVASFD